MRHPSGQSTLIPPPNFLEETTTLNLESTPIHSFIYIINMSNTRSCLTTSTLAVLACVVAFHGVVAPFPPDDPRAIVNYFAIPMWRGIPLKWRQTMHIHYTGKELPKEDVESFKGNFFDRSDKRKTVFEMIGDKTNRNVDKLRKSARKSFFSFVKNPLGVERKDRSGRALKFR